jgi:acyl-CoA dehydrogenase
MWEFSTDPEFQHKLDWMTAFVRDECEPLDLLFPHAGTPYDVHHAASRAIVKPLQDQVRAQGLWACHLGPQLGGQGFGQVKLALMNEILGRSYWAPTVFGTAAPDTGNAEILALYGTGEQRERYLQPLLDGTIVSCFSMTEPQGGADPKEFTCRATRDGDEWVIDGEKWFSSNARYATFLIVMVVTEPDAKPHERMSMFIVPADTPGIEIIRNVGTVLERDDLDEGIHGYIRYHQVRVPLKAMLGAPGEGFKVAQSRLGGGRVHHAMRVVGKCQRAFDMMCERALSRFTQGSRLADKQMVQEKIADSWMEIEQFRLLVLRTAWKIDRYKDYLKVRKDIAAVKALMPKVFHDVASRALFLHGSLGATNEMPFVEQVIQSFHMGLADGPTEVHKITVARQILREYKATDDLFPTQHIPKLREAALKKYADKIEHEVHAQA